MPDKILLDAGSSGEQGWSTSSTILRCGRKWRLRREGYTDGSRAPLIKGSLVHVGLAHYYARLQADQQGWDPDRYYTPAEAVALLSERNGPPWAEHRQLATKAVAGYQRRMSAYPERVIAVEHLIEVDVPVTFGREHPAPDDGELGRLRHLLACELPETITHRARIDLICEAPDGRFIIRDHKTSSDPRATSTTPFDLSGQIVGLTWWGQQQWGERFGGVEIGAINLTTGRIDFRRPKLAPHAVAEWPKMRTWIEVQKRVLRALYGNGMDYPMALSDQGPCLDRYGPCGFRESCRMGLPELEETAP